MSSSGVEWVNQDRSSRTLDKFLHVLYTIEVLEVEIHPEQEGRGCIASYRIASYLVTRTELGQVFRAPIRQKSVGVHRTSVNAKRPGMGSKQEHGLIDSA